MSAALDGLVARRPARRGSGRARVGPATGRGAAVPGRARVAGTDVSARAASCVLLLCKAVKYVYFICCACCSLMPEGTVTLHATSHGSANV